MEMLYQFYLPMYIILILRSILELGSGLGLTGIFTCMECKPRHYTFSDCHYLVLDRLKENIMLNFEDSDNYSIDIKYGSDKIIENGVHKIAKSTIELIDIDCETVSEHKISKLQPDIILGSGKT